MKKLTDLDKPQESYEEPKSGEKLPTYRELIRVALGRITPKNSEESLDMHTILSKLRGKDSDIELENAEFKTLIEVVGRNEVKMFQVSHGPLLTYLKACEKASEEKKTPLEVK